MLMRGLYDILQRVSRSVKGVVLFSYGGCRIKHSGLGAVLISVVAVDTART